MRPEAWASIVVSAGIIANVIFAYVIIFVQVLSVGLPVQEAFPGVLVPEVKTFSAASRDGLLSGDVILSVDGAELTERIREFAYLNPKSNFTLFKRG
ncbi:hypothetical protein DY000_02042021 [Brassica cretica]|uniref:PDZ domain-containing protein n=1 Tax=Brassica cretica TaxID=69181 RepID=A0ABQ7B9L1_BRACR|nr:hypothetical protein DY000_02042021 [Brassica cretica]